MAPEMSFIYVCFAGLLWTENHFCDLQNLRFDPMEMFKHVFI